MTKKTLVSSVIPICVVQILSLFRCLRLEFHLRFSGSVTYKKWWDMARICGAISQVLGAS